MEIRSTSLHVPHCAGQIIHMALTVIAKVVKRRKQNERIKTTKRPKGKDFNLFCTKAGAQKLQHRSPEYLKISQDPLKLYQVGVIECYSSIPND